MAKITASLFPEVKVGFLWCFLYLFQVFLIAVSSISVFHALNFWCPTQRPSVCQGGDTHSTNTQMMSTCVLSTTTCQWAFRLFTINSHVFLFFFFFQTWPFSSAGHRIKKMSIIHNITTILLLSQTRNKQNNWGILWHSSSFTLLHL